MVCITHDRTIRLVKSHMLCCIYVQLLIFSIRDKTAFSGKKIMYLFCISSTEIKHYSEVISEIQRVGNCHSAVSLSINKLPSEYIKTLL